MQLRKFGRTGWLVGEVGFGAWAIGADWGQVSDDQAMAALHAACDAGVNLFDTADVYGDGRSEQLLARLRRERPGEEIHIVTKAGRRLDPHVAGGYTEAALNEFVDRSRRLLETDTLELVQLHCPPTDVYYRPEVFATMDRMVAAGKIARWGVSVERVEEALKAIEWPSVASVQIIFNMFRQRPAERFFAEAAERDVAILARVPLASGLLTGKMRPDSTFPADDHRTYNRHGEAFDVGETFSGVPYAVGLEAVEELRPLAPHGSSLAQFALRWILMHPEVSVVIPGAKNPEQAGDNAKASAIEPLPPETMDAVRDIYDRRIRPHVHHRW